MGNNTDEDLANLIQLGDVGSSLDAELIMDMIKNITVNSTIEREMACTLHQNQSQVRNKNNHHIGLKVYNLLCQSSWVVVGLRIYSN